MGVKGSGLDVPVGLSGGTVGRDARWPKFPRIGAQRVQVGRYVDLGAVLLLPLALAHLHDLLALHNPLRVEAGLFGCDLRRLAGTRRGRGVNFGDGETFLT